MGRASDPDERPTFNPCEHSTPPEPTATARALAELRRIAPKHLNDYAADFERQAAGHPEIKTRVAVRMAALLRALANEESP